MIGARSRHSLAPGARIRVLVVDDSVVIRRLVTHALENDPQLEVVGAAPNGVAALARIPQVSPDVVTLDVEMPEMDGLEALRHIRRDYPALRVIMFSTLSVRGGEVTLQALALGADDYVTKASNVGALDRSIVCLRDELIPKIKQFFHLGPIASPTPSPKVALADWRPPLTAAPRVLVIGVSTGGPAALGAIMPRFPSDFPLPILVVQHMPALFTRLLADRLAATSKLTVEEATEGATVEPGKTLIAPGDFHMKLTRTSRGAKVHLDQSPPENSCRPAVDVLFRSAAEVYGGSVLAAVLTGMGHDGLRGAETLKALGACVIAQDEFSSVVWGMPGAVVGAGMADVVTPLDGLVPEILRRAAN